MDLNVNSQDETIRKIEDVIDLQKSKGNFCVRQVAFNLPSESNSTDSTNFTKSLESGLSNKQSKSENNHKRLKKLKLKRSKSPLPEVISSDSDITVLRMKLHINSNLKKNMDTVKLGDGLHQPDSSSMVNLATLILQTQSPSKHSISVEECLLPLTSWEPQQNRDSSKLTTKRVHTTTYCAADAMCSYEDDYLSIRDSDYSKNTKMSRMARFLRLYFCPCCTYLYRLEKMQEEPSACFTKGMKTDN